MKAKKIKICDWSLVATGTATLATGIVLEPLAGSSSTMIWTHIGVASAMSVLCVYHIYLHFGWQHWIKKFSAFKKPATIILAIFLALTIVSGVVAAIHWLQAHTHSTIGGVHGKIGFIFILFCALHTLKRKKFLASKSK